MHPKLISLISLEVGLYGRYGCSIGALFSVMRARMGAGSCNEQELWQFLRNTRNHNLIHADLYYIKGTDAFKCDFSDDKCDYRWLLSSYSNGAINCDQVYIRSRDDGIFKRFISFCRRVGRDMNELGMRILHCIVCSREYGITHAEVAKYLFIFHCIFHS